MTVIEALRKQVKKYLDNAGEASLRKVQAILEIDQQEDFWDGLPSTVKDDVEHALLQSERGEGKSHADVMKQYDKWRTK